MEIILSVCEAVGGQNADYWDNLRGYNMTCPMVCGYNTGLGGPIVAFRTNVYTLQIFAKVNASEIQFRVWYNDISQWKGWNSF